MPTASQIWLDGFDVFALSREQKTIVLLGYSGHVVSPKEIWDAVGIVDTDYYRRLLVSLRELGILRRSISKSEAHFQAKRRKIPVKHVPQFSIDLPLQVRPIAKKEPAPDDADYARLY